MTISIVIRLALLFIVSYPLFLLMEYALPGTPLFVPLYIGLIYFSIHSAASVNKSGLLDGPGLYDHHRIANLVITGAVFSVAVYLLRNYLETDVGPDLQRSLLYWQLLFGIFAASIIPKLVILNQGIFESLFSIKPRLPVVAVWIVSFGFMALFNSSLISLGVITVTSVWVCRIQVNSMDC